MLGGKIAELFARGLIDPVQELSTFSLSAGGEITKDAKSGSFCSIMIGKPCCFPT